MEVNFKFEIGDILRHKATPKSRISFCVVERSLQQCYGGIQLHYTLRPLMEEDKFSIREEAKGWLMPECAKLVQMTEFELEKVNLPAASLERSGA